MAKKDRKTEMELQGNAAKEDADSPLSIIEDILRKDLDNVVTVLNSKGNGKSTLYEDVMTIVDRSLFKIALNRSGQVKTTAATYLGVNRNTFQKKMIKLGMNGRED